MIEEKWLFIGTDKRLSECSRIMSGNGKECRSIKTNSYTSELERELINFAPQTIVFPIVEMDGSIPLELLQDCVNFYTGIVSDEWLEPYKDAALTIESYLQEELFIWENARLTAEGFLIVYYSEMGRTIAGKRFHVAGYGRVGKMVVDTLTALGGDVTVIARSDSQLGEAKMRGLKAEQLTDDVNMSGSYLVNTIPAKWLTVKQNTPTFIFDLASAPGCLKETRAFEYYTLRPGLPGKYFPVDAASALAGALERIHRR